jgi:hypothetical protein
LNYSSYHLIRAGKPCFTSAEDWFFPGVIVDKTPPVDHKLMRMFFAMVTMPGNSL